ncbi:Fc.00g006430.m01.CDS01 [Cosmosporella sp. VM-42]
MSASPSCSPPRRPLHERSGSQNNSQNNRLQIRVVPYSPPRLASEGSGRVVSYADASTETGPELLAKSSSPLPYSSPYYDAPSPTPSSPNIRPFGSALRHAPSFGTPVPTVASWDPDAYDVTSDLYSEPSSPLRPSSSRREVIVHSDKTFSVFPQPVSASSKTDSVRSPRPSNTTGSLSHGRLSSNAFTEDRPSSPLTPLTERSISYDSPALFATVGSSSSPWNYRMVGGVRKVPKTPDTKQKQRRTPSMSSSELPLPPLPEIALPNLVSAPEPLPLSEKLSFQSSLSSQTGSTLSDRTNFKIYGRSSPVNVAELDSLPPSSSHSNYQVHGQPSSNPPVYDQTRPQTGESEGNYVVHGDQSSTGSSLVAVRTGLRPEFSRESLIVPPLRPTKRSSSEQLGFPKSRSRDSLRTGSLTSISSFLTQEATRAVFAGPATLLNQGGLSWQDSFSGFTNTHARTQMPASQPHHWSSQLSTVISESEGGSESASRSLSPTSVADRHSSGWNSSHSRHILSLSSSLAGLGDFTDSPSHSRHGSLERPQATFNRSAIRDPNFGNIRLIRDQDEDGDGLADLEELRHRPSRTRMGNFLTSRSSDRSLRSRASSFNSGSIPTWARFYYGSGERRWLAAQASSESMYSDYSDSRNGGSFLSRSPSNDPQPPIFSPRRRQREYPPQTDCHGSNAGSMDITPAPAHPVMAVVRTIKKQTSSIWSPHLGRDRRASRYSIWETSAVDWTARSEMNGRRNSQIAMFVVGFIFPFAWMLAGIIPLYPPKGVEVTERDHSTSNLHLRRNPASQTPSIDETVYHSARWWRNVNRGMSLIGLLVLGAVIALIVVGVKQRW